MVSKVLPKSFLTLRTSFYSEIQGTHEKHAEDVGHAGICRKCDEERPHYGRCARYKRRAITYDFNPYRSANRSLRSRTAVGPARVKMRFISQGSIFSCAASSISSSTLLKPLQLTSVRSHFLYSATRSSAYPGSKRYAILRCRNLLFSRCCGHLLRLNHSVR